MKKWEKLAAKAGMILLLLLLFCILIKKDRQERGMLVPEGEKIQIKDAISLVMAFGRKASLSEEQREKLENWSLQVSEAHGEGESSLLTYGDYIELTAIWDQDRETENTEKDPEKELDQK